MMRPAWYALALWITLTVQTTAVASLSAPLQFFPLALVVGLIVLHERSLSLGVTWIVVSGLILEARGLGSGLGVASCVAGCVAAFLATFIFAQRSFWALLGVAGGSAIAYVLARILWLAMSGVFTGSKLPFGEIAENSLQIVAMIVAGVFVFGAYIRRLIRSMHDRFVSKGQIYEISFPHSS